MPRAPVTSAIPAIGCSTPISLLASITLTSTVSSVSARSIDSGLTRPSPSGATSVTWAPASASRRHGSSTARCSVATVTMCGGRPAAAATAPFSARLFDSVAPLVKQISRGSAPTTPATCRRAASAASRAAQPNAWCRLAALPNRSVKYGAIASTTRGATGVVAW